MMVAVVQSSAVLLLALCAAWLFRKQSAALRHAVLTAGLVSSLVVPFLGGILPEFEFADGSALYARVQDPTTVIWELTSGLDSSSAGDHMPAGVSSFPFRWVWIAGMLAAGMLLIAGAGRIWSLVIRSTPLVQMRWISASQEVVQALRLKRRVRLFENDSAILGTWGILRPVVFLPRNAADWPDDRIRVVLMHELAHIKRFDWPVQILAEIARAVYWFNPLFWVACRWLRSESEHACDDVVLNAGVDGRDYAAHLLDLARSFKQSERAWSPVLAMSQPPNLERRFVAMLNPSMNHRSLTRPALFWVCVVAIALTLPLAAMRVPEQVRQSPAATAPFQSVPVSNTVANKEDGNGPTTRVRVSAPAIKPPEPAPPSVASKPVPPKPVQGRADGSLWGTISDGSGAVVPGVTVTIAGVNQQTMETITGSAGEYEFRALPPGLYLLTAQLPGFMNATSRINIRSSETSRQNMTLSLGAVAQRVEVTAYGQAKPAPAPGAPPQRIRVGGNIRAPRLIGQVRPTYPLSARDAGIEGNVRLQGVIAADGTLVGLRAVNNIDADLRKAALEAASQWRYEPALLNGEPFETFTQIDIEFRLTQ